MQLLTFSLSYLVSFAIGYQLTKYWHFRNTSLCDNALSMFAHFDRDRIQRLKPNTRIRIPAIIPPDNPTDTSKS